MKNMMICLMNFRPQKVKQIEKNEIGSYLEEAEAFYIGIGNFAEQSGSVPLIYDWRAPVSGLFYDYDKGPASYEIGRAHV